MPLQSRAYEYHYQRMESTDEDEEAGETDAFVAGYASETNKGSVS